MNPPEIVSHEYFSLLRFSYYHYSVSHPVTMTYKTFFLLFLQDCSQMEDQLSALGERWSHVCQWAEQRAVALQQLADHWEHLDTNLKRLKNWLASHEHALRLIEANPSADRTQMIDVARQLQV